MWNSFPKCPDALPEKLEREDNKTIDKEYQNKQMTMRSISLDSPTTSERVPSWKISDSNAATIDYFRDRGTNDPVLEESMFTRRKNLISHFGVDETVSKREVEKINTYCLPVPSSVLPQEAQEALATTIR